MEIRLELKSAAPRKAIVMTKGDFEDLTTQLDSQRRSVSFDNYDITVRQLLDMFETGAIDIAPDYQRQFIWDNFRQSELIESVLLGIPVPSLFMATNRDATWELGAVYKVIDAGIEP
jgi:hypothetical protein